MWGLVVLKHLQIFGNNYNNKHESMFSLCTGHSTTVVQEVWSHKKWVWPSISRVIQAFQV